MPSPELDNLVAAGHLQKEPPARTEFDRLIRSGRARLADSHIPSLSLDSRFDLAYNAAHSLSLAALRWHGYRPVNRFIVFQALQHTLGLGPAVWRVLDLSHRQRNRGEYEGDFEPDERIVVDLIAATELVEAAVMTLVPPPTERREH